MIPNNNLSVLPFYTSIDKQNHKKSYANGEIYTLITPIKTIPPFQIIRETLASSIQSAFLVNESGQQPTEDILNSLKSTGLEIFQADGYDIIKYKSSGLLSEATPEGKYYIVMFDGTNLFYSDIFTFVNSVDDCIKLEYWDSENLVLSDGQINFEYEFKYWVYLRTKIGRPDYEFEEVVVKRDGYQFIEKQISEKIYKFTFLASEYLCDALRVVRMVDNIIITAGSESYTVDTFLMTPKWQDDGFIAAVEVEFQCDTVIKKISARYTEIDEEVLPISVKMYIGTLTDLYPSEAMVKTMEERIAVRENQQWLYTPKLGHRNCFAYPAEYGDLSQIYFVQGSFWDLLNSFVKSQLTFTFGSDLVLMNIYTFVSPVRLEIDLSLNINYNF